MKTIKLMIVFMAMHIFLVISLFLDIAHAFKNGCSVEIGTFSVN